jgi:cell division protein FtsI (penicillin-binding protein 3)
MRPRSPFHVSMRIDGERSSALDQARGRIVLIVGFILLAYIVVAGRLFDVTIIQGYFHAAEETPREQQAQNNNQTTKTRRGDIIDRNGVLLATSLKTASLYADAKMMTDPEGTAKQLVKIFPNLIYGDLLKKFQSERRFIWIHRNLTPQEQQKILGIGDPGLSFDYDYKRIYPQGRLTAHMVGYTDVDGRGLSGIERSFNASLTKNVEPIRLSLDIRLQHVLRRETQKAISDFNGIGGAGLIMNVRTGEILAAVSLPDFDPHDPSSNKNDVHRFNRVTLGVYELGSTFKIFTAAALLEKKHVSMATTFDAREPLHRGNRIIRDFHPEKRVMTVPEVFMYSSNIGTALMGEAIGTQGLKALYTDLGLMNRMNFEIDEMGRPLMPNPWRDINTLTASYGHGIAVTPLQLVSAVSAIVNGGTLVRPILVMKDHEDTKPQTAVRVISKETSLKMRQLMRLVVSDGTARKADVTGYMVGGKTGTAQKNINGRYIDDKRISSFVGVFPMNDPEYAVFVMVDEPKPNKTSYGYATAGWVAAPAVGRVISAFAPLYHLPPQKTAVDLAAPLRAYLTKKSGEEH